MDQATAAALDALLAAARSNETPHHHADQETAMLQAVVEAAALLFGAQAASIALFEREPDRLEFRVAAGTQGAGVVGLSVPPTRGIAGYVFSTGQPMALSDVTADPRFDRATAERTGYVPRSIAAVPLSGAETSLGVLQVLDRTGSGSFSLSDMARLGVFADQASVAIGASRVARDSARFLWTVLRDLGDGPTADSEVEALVTEAAAGLDPEDEPPFWRLVDSLSRLGDRSEPEVHRIADVLAVVARHWPGVGTYPRRVRTRGRTDGT